MDTEFDVIIVGAGLSGAVCAERFANILRKRVLLIDQRDHIGGNCYDTIDEETGILYSKYGAHIFHTNNEQVWRYVTSFAKFARYDHRVIAKVGSKTIPLPVNINTVNTIFDEASLTNGDDMVNFMDAKRVSLQNPPRNGEESCLSRFGTEIYECLFKPYTTKQWERDPKDLHASVLDRIPMRFNFDDRYFADKYQGMPTDGYTAMVANMLSSPLIEVRLNTVYDKTSGPSAPIVIFTGPIDSYFADSNLGRLEYRSLRFEIERKHTEGYSQTHFVVNYPDLQVPYTRIAEYKHVFGNDKRAPRSSLLVYEYPSSEGPEYYPVVDAKNIELYEKYRDLAHKAEKDGVYFLGRLASFKYVNMDRAIENALQFFDKTFVVDKIG